MEGSPTLRVLGLSHRPRTSDTLGGSMKIKIWGRSCVVSLGGNEDLVDKLTLLFDQMFEMGLNGVG